MGAVILFWKNNIRLCVPFCEAGGWRRRKTGCPKVKGEEEKKKCGGRGCGYFVLWYIEVYGALIARTPYSE